MVETIETGRKNVVDDELQAKANWAFKGCPHRSGGIAFTKNGASSQLHAVTWTGKDEIRGLYHSTSKDRGKSWNEVTKFSTDKARTWKSKIIVVN